MKITPNLGGPMRIAYLLIGLALIVGPFAFAAEGAMRIAFPILGVLSIATGATGW